MLNTISKEQTQRAKKLTRVKMVIPLIFLLLCAGQGTDDEEGEVFEFQADVQRVLDIFIHSLYTNKEIFLRETISNASDALDKVRYLSITDDSILAPKKEMEIYIDYDKDQRVVSITDTGIGMTKEDLVKHLGVIARSGTNQFLEALSQGGDINLIGQFGVGFYSNFLVADEIVVTSKNNDDDQHIWVSKASNTFKVFKDPRGDTLGRGTRVSIKLKQDASEFLNQDTLRKIVKKYSEFVDYPIFLRVQEEVSKEVPLTEEELEQAEDDVTTKIVKEKEWMWERVNENKPIWLRDDVEEDSYNSFYKSLSRDSRDPMSYVHFTAEGDVVFKALLYIPSVAPSDLMQNVIGKSAPIKLYVKRVLINEEFTDLLPKYLSFIRGIVDSDDLPLNVARENLQHNKILKMINKKLTRKVLQELIELSEIEYEEDEVDEYIEFYKQFGKNIKLGVIDDTANKSKLTKLIRFNTTKSKEELTSFSDYIDRMKDGQDDIYFIVGEDKTKLEASPLIQKLVERDFEVILMDDPIDEYTMNAINEVEKHHLQNVGADDWTMPEEDEEIALKTERALKKYYGTTLNWLEGVIKPYVNQVVISRKLHDDMSLITSRGEDSHSANLERLARASTFSLDNTHEKYVYKIWEINPKHPITWKLYDYAENDPLNFDKRDLTITLYDLSLIQCGYIMYDSVGFYKRVQKLISLDMGVKPDEEISEPYVEVNTDDFESLDDLSNENEL